MKSFLDFLEKGSAFLDKISKPMERRMAYFLCTVQIVVCLMAIFAAIIFFIYNFIGQTSFDVRVVMILSGTVILFVLGSYVYLLITRDLKHFRSQISGKGKEKNNPLEFK